jgi:hypothetical protein
MNKLWAFGDSYTAGILPDIDHFTPYVEYLKFLGIKKQDFPKSWPYQLAHKLNMEPIVFATGGASNEEITMNILNNIPTFQKNDIVIVEWSYMNRYMWALPNKNHNSNEIAKPFGKFNRCSIYTEFKLENGYVPTEVFKHVGINKSLDAWTLQIQLFQNMLEYLSNLIGFHLFIWSSDDNIYKNIKSDKWIIGDIVLDYLSTNTTGNSFLKSIRPFGATSILQETNGKVNDCYHLGIRGNEAQSNLFFEYIKKYLDNL